MSGKGQAIVEQAASARRALSAGDYAQSLALAVGGTAARDLPIDRLAIGIEAMIKAGDFASAEKAMNDLARRPGAEMILLRLQGHLAIIQRNDTRAIATHEAALALRPDDEWHRVRLARAHVRQGAVPRARAVLAAGMALRSGAFGLLIEDAAILRKAGMLVAATDRLAAAERLQPDSARLFRQQGELATAMGDHVQAAALHAASLAREPHIPGQRVRAVRSLEKAGKPDEALQLMQDGLAAHPRSAPLLAEIARMRIRREQPQAAAHNIERLTTAYPNDVRARDLLAELAEATGDRDGLARQLSKQMKRFPLDPGIRVRLADEKRRSGDRRGALALVQGIATPTARSRMLEARLLIELGEHDAARAILDGWDSSDTALIDRARIAMRLASAEYNFADSGAAADAILARLHDDAEAGKARALARILTFDIDAAWGALKAVPGVPLGPGPARRGARRLRSLFGHIANEFRLRDVQTRRLAAKASEGDGALRREAGAILRRDPASLPAAFAMLMTQARGGALHARPAKGPAAIPPLLHQYWDRNLPEDVAALIEDTRVANAGLEHRLWDDASARAFLGAFDDPLYLRAYKRARHVAVKSDLLRLALLWRLGGFYMDADDLAVAPVAALAPPGTGLLLYQERMASIGNNFMAAVPGHPLIKRMLDQAAGDIDMGCGEAPWLATGPGLVSRVIAAELANDAKALRRHAVHILWLSAFRATVEAGRKADYKQGVRHWKRAG